ncbi:hypothetical protein CUJ91_12360 [Paraburkholderia graminis]|nr:hypothetical protein CUJ91_12360 [Paraburkholderia graminis]
MRIIACCCELRFLDAPTAREMTGSIHCPAIACLAQPGHSDDGEGASGRLSWVRELAGERAEERTDKRTNDQLATKRSTAR